MKDFLLRTRKMSALGAAIIVLVVSLGILIGGQLLFDKNLEEILSTSIVGSIIFAIATYARAKIYIK